MPQRATKTEIAATNCQIFNKQKPKNVKLTNIFNNITKKTKHEQTVE